ncbi:MAG: C10 family peptidase [Bacteroidales bacterium]|nr:C10 family peptidase [Bacteroidales bacterium]
MSKYFTVLFLFCAISSWAQQPLLTTQWSQGSPYNQLCPADPLENYKHSYTGCPATAMGQILNYLQTTQGTRFDDSDDYYTGNYVGRQFHIDDDWSVYDFPSFPQLNAILDSVDSTFQRGEELTDSMMAAIVFACGVACKQVYSASDSYGSGTFYVDQAFEAYQRFGFTDCQLFREPDSTMYAILISNLQDGYPAHLAVENPAGTSGHNVVVDGYRESDGKFHINFGWGGSMDNWYSLPDPNGYSCGWTKIEGLIVNIIPSTPHEAVRETPRRQALVVYPNPATEVLYIKNLPCEAVEYAIYDVYGQKMAAGVSTGAIPVAELNKGVYLLQVRGDKFQKTAKFIVK